MLQKKGVQLQGVLADKKVAMAVTTLVGTIVGAGVLGIPYTIAKAGFLYGSILIVALGFAFLFLNLFAGEIVLRTKTQSQLPGYGGKYLGFWGKFVLTCVMIFSIYGALTAYLIGEGATLHSLFGYFSPLTYSLLFFVATFFIIYKGIKATGRMELILISCLVLVVLAIGVLSFDKINPAHFDVFNPAFFFLPYGVVLFAFTALPAIPEVAEILGKDRAQMKRSIIIGSLIPIALYLLFAFVIVGVIGLANFEALSPNERIATIALQSFSHPVLGVLANILAFLAMFTSFLTLAIALLEVYTYDYDIPKSWAMVLTFAVPLLIVLFNLTSFITVLAITGAVAGGIEAIMIVLTYWAAKRKSQRVPEYNMKVHRVLGSVLIVLFLVGMVYSVVGLF